jgi:hypothetical protein
MKTLIIILMLFAFAPELMAQRSERYRSRSDSGYSQRPNYAERQAPRSKAGQRFDRYQSKPRSERQRFDQNLNKYNSYSPQQKRQAQERWKNFKEKTTPEERAYIREKMRNRRSGGR